MEQAICESCKKVIAEAETYDDAKEIAVYEFDARYWGGDTGPGDFECAECYAKRERSWT